MSIHASCATSRLSWRVMLAAPEKNRHRKSDDCSETDPPGKFHHRQPGGLVTQPRTLSGSIAQGFFSLQGARQGLLLLGDRVRAGVFDLVGLTGVEFDVFREFRWKVRLRVNRVHRTYIYTRRAIDAFLGMDHELV